MENEGKLGIIVCRLGLVLNGVSIGKGAAEGEGRGGGEKKRR